MLLMCPKILRRSPKILPLTSVSSFSPPSVLCWPIMTSPNLMFLIRDQHLHIKLISFYPVLVIVGAFDVPPIVIKRLTPSLFLYVNNTWVSTDNLFVAILCVRIARSTETNATTPPIDVQHNVACHWQVSTHNVTTKSISCQVLARTTFNTLHTFL